MRKNLHIQIRPQFVPVADASGMPVVLPMRSAERSAWQGKAGTLIEQEFDGSSGYLYSFELTLSESVRIPVRVDMADLHILYLMQAEQELTLYTAEGQTLCHISPARARYLYLPAGHYELEIPRGFTHVFGFYFSCRIFRDGNERPFDFFRHLIEAKRKNVDTPFHSDDFEVGPRTLAHIQHICRNLKKGQLDNESFVVHHLVVLIKLSKEKYLLEYKRQANRKHIAKYIHRAIKDHFSRQGQNFTIEEVVAPMKYSQNYYNRLHKKYYGITLHQYKTKLTLKAAKKYLKLGESPVDCAYMCGYNSLEVFSHFFKSQTGFSPSDYLNKQQ